MGGVGRSILLVGEAPARDRWKRHLEVALACRAAGLRPGRAGWERLDEERPDLFEFSCRTAHVNLLNYYPGGSGRGSAFPEVAAKAEALRLERLLGRGGDLVIRGVSYVAFNGERFRAPRAVLLAGKRVAGAFGLEGLDYFDQSAIGGADAYVVPHPSGVNRWWNDPWNRGRAAGFLVELLEAWA